MSADTDNSVLADESRAEVCGDVIVATGIWRTNPPETADCLARVVKTVGAASDRPAPPEWFSYLKDCRGMRPIYADWRPLAYVAERDADCSNFPRQMALTTDT